MRGSLFILLVTMFILFSGASCSQKPVENAVPSTSLKTSKKVFKPGEPVMLLFTYQNTFDKPIKISVPVDLSLEISVSSMNPTGKTTPLAVYKVEKGPAVDAVIEPKATLEKSVDLSKIYPGIAKDDGVYVVSWPQASGSPKEVKVVVMRDYKAEIETNYGKIVAEFYPDSAPLTVLNFVTLAKKGYYNNLIFHRIIRGFMMQGGCPQGTGSGSPGYMIKAEFNPRPHVLGTLSMARSDGFDTAGSQFFICFGTVSGLDNQYTVFGGVTQGIEVVKAIEKVKTDHDTKPGQCGRAHSDRPLEPVKMTKITMVDKDAPKDGSK